jgi:hypothetical protein
VKMKPGFLIVVGACFGCSPTESNRDRPAPMPLAFRQESEADVVLDFLNWNHWEFPGKSESELPDPPVKDRESLSSALESRDHRGKSAVVVFFTAAEVHDEDVLALEAIFKKAGFRSLVVQQGVGFSIGITTGRPILKEVEFDPWRRGHR